jgi:hypothetical protein
MVRRLALLLVALFVLAAPLAADPLDEVAVNPLAGHDVTALVPDAVLTIEAGRAVWTWRGPLTLEIDGRAAALVALPPAEAPLPRRRWGTGDYLVAAGVAVAAGILGAGLGYVAGALR